MFSRSQLLFQKKKKKRIDNLINQLMSPTTRKDCVFDLIRDWITNLNIQSEKHGNDQAFYFPLN